MGLSKGERGEGNLWKTKKWGEGGGKVEKERPVREVF